MYFLAKLRFETVDDNGKTKKIREQFLVEALSVEDAANKVTERFGDGISPAHVESVQESKILGLLQ